MKLFYGLILYCLSLSNALSVEVSQMGIKIDPKHSPGPSAELKSHRIVGTCEGKTYTSQAEFDGCVRNVSARLPNTTLSGGSLITNPTRPVPTTEQAQ